MTHHTLTAELEIRFTPTGCTETEVAYPTIEIAYTYLPGSPQRGPTYWSGGEPADPAEVELVSARLIDGDGLDPDAKQIDDWAQGYLDSDRGYEAACREAAASEAEARAEAYDTRNDAMRDW